MNEINWEQEARISEAQRERQRKLASGWVEPEDPGNSPGGRTLQDLATSYESATDYISRGIINALSADLGGENNLLNIMPVQRPDGWNVTGRPELPEVTALRQQARREAQYVYRDDATDAARAAVPYLRSEQPIIRHYRVPQLTGPDLDILVEVRENESRVVLNRENRQHLGHVIAALGLVGRAAEDTRRLLEGVINQCGPDSAVVRANDGTFYVQPTRVSASYDQLGSMGQNARQQAQAMESGDIVYRDLQARMSRTINRVLNNALINGNNETPAPSTESEIMMRHNWYNNQRTLGDGGPPPNPTGTNVPRVVPGEHPDEYVVVLRFEDQNNWDNVLTLLCGSGGYQTLNWGRQRLVEARDRLGYPLRVVYNRNHNSFTTSHYIGAASRPSDLAPAQPTEAVIMARRRADLTRRLHELGVGVELGNRITDGEFVWGGHILSYSDREWGIMLQEMAQRITATFNAVPRS